MSKKILSVVIAVVMIAATFIPAFSVFADEVPGVQTPVTEDTSLWDRVDDDGWYTAPDGGFKFNVGTWKYYGQYSLNIVENPNSFPTNCANISVYAPGSSSVDSQEVFENKTKANFESVLQETVNVFEKRTVGNEKDTMYYAQTNTYENYVFQANGTKYFINFIWAGSGTKEDFAAFAAQVMSTIIIADDAEPDPASIEIIEGANASWDVSSEDGLVFVSSADYAEFSQVEIDGEVVDAENYTVEEGSTKVTLKAEYLKTLAEGAHSISIVSEAGTAATRFVITNNPDTGDNFMVYVAVVTAVLALAVIVLSKKSAKAR